MLANEDHVISRDFTYLHVSSSLLTTNLHCYSIHVCQYIADRAADLINSTNHQLTLLCLQSILLHLLSISRCPHALHRSLYLFPTSVFIRAKKWCQHCHNSRGRFCSKQENAPPAAPAKRVRFRGEEEPPLPMRSCFMAVKSANGLQLLSSESINGRQMVISNGP
jgi:hypothetical protein